MTDFAYLAWNAAGLMIVMLLLWWLAVRIRDVSFIDAVWAFGMVGLTWASVMQTHGRWGRMTIIAGLVTLWGGRLGFHLLTRWQSAGPDRRYTAILGRAMETKGWSFARASLLLVFLLQAPLLFFVSLPAQIGVAGSEQGPGWLAACGAVISLIGIGFETLGDAQLARFRSDPANAGRVLETGLWRYTRHPNYFGDACTWWGIWLVAAETQAGVWTLACPMFLTWLLLRWSGVPMLERGLTKSRPGYADYVARTSGFFPLPPRRRG